MDPYTIPLGNYNFPRSTNKIWFFDEISTSGKICQFNEGWGLGGWWWVGDGVCGMLVRDGVGGGVEVGWCGG